MHTGAAQANEGPIKVTEFAASGLIFKDSVEVVSFADPDGTSMLHHLHHAPVMRTCAPTIHPPIHPPCHSHAVENVVIFISDFKRSLADKLAKDFFSEPSQASVTCAATGPITIKNPNVKASGGQEVFSEGKGLNLFQQKTLR